MSGIAVQLNEIAERETLRGIEELALPRIPRFRGEVRLPGSKSISNRALLMAALCSSSVEIRNLLDADDVRVMRENLPELGVLVLEKPGRGGFSADFDDGDRTAPVLVTGSGGPFKVNRLELNLDNAGTALRPMTALLAAGSGEFVLDGDEQMRRRPIGELATLLTELGAEVTATSGCPPLRIKTTGLRGGPLKIRGHLASSQFLSALLMAGPFMREDLDFELREDPISKPYIDLTIAMMSDFGIQVEREGYRRFRVPRGGYESPGVYHVEGDASAATYFMALGALPGSGPVTVRGLSRDSRQGDAGFAGLLADMGARVEWGDNSCTVRGAEHGLRAPDLDMNHMPDAAMTLAVLALFAEGETHIRNIANLRVKESERIRGLKTELEKLGAGVRETPDSLHITPAKEYRSASIATYKDHRMAMAFSLAAAAADIRIQDPACVGKTYPEYFRDFLTLIPGE